jgi:hypothetical protein
MTLGQAAGQETVEEIGGEARRGNAILGGTRCRWAMPGALCGMCRPLCHVCFPMCPSLVPDAIVGCIAVETALRLYPVTRPRLASTPGTMGRVRGKGHKPAIRP